MGEVIKVVLVDDHPVVREGLRAFLQLAGDIEVVGEADGGRAAVSLLCDKRLDATVVIMDLKMPGEMNGIEAIRQIKGERPELQFLALTSFQDDASALAALSAGAIGYLYKDVSPDLLLGGIRQAASGRMVLEQNVWTAAQGANAIGQPGRAPTAEPNQLSPEGGGHHSDEERHSPEATMEVPFDMSQPSEMANVAKGQTATMEALTEREHEVLRAMAKGLSNKEIGGLLGITEKTVKAHVSHILGKLGVYDRTQAVLLAIKRKLVEVL